MSTHNITLSISKRKSSEIISNTIKSAAMGYLLGIQERVQNTSGKRATSVRATEVLLCTVCTNMLHAQVVVSYL